MKKISDFTIVQNEVLSDRLFLMRLTPSDGHPMEACRAGQFVEVRVDHEPGVFLRRPISIHRVDVEHNELWLLVQRAGTGTNHLGQMSVGQTVNIVYPLGNGYAMPVASADGHQPHYLLIGGGVGVAPLLETGHQFVLAGAKVSFLLGGRTAGDIAQVAQFQNVGTVYITTEDGSTLAALADGMGADGQPLCQKGFATQHSILTEGRFDGIRVCGPGPMMKAVAKVVSPWKQNEEKDFCQVSLENKMACGLGVCLCCVEDTRDGHKCVCSDGPVFDIKDLKWA